MIRNLIYLTHNNRIKIAEMCESLLPKVGYARVTRFGIVILKRSKWSLFRKRIPVTDVVIKYIPIEISKLIATKDKRAVYLNVLNDRVATIVSLTKYMDRLDLLEEVYKEYAKACFFNHDISIDIFKNYVEPIPKKIQLFSINTVLNKEKRSTASSGSISKRVNNLKEKLNKYKLIIPNINLHILYS